jgi:hypothetical protein
LALPCDSMVTCYCDLQFYFSEKDVGKNRAEVSLAMLSDLNQYVNVNVNNAELSNDMLKQFQASFHTNMARLLEDSPTYHPLSYTL